MSSPAAGTASDKVIETHGLTKAFGNGVVAVQDLDLNVMRGEVYGFLGPNGAGKTTTLRMLLGLTRPTHGTATVAGFAPGHPEGLRRLGAIVETPAFYPYLSGRDNLRVLADYAGAPHSRIDAALDTVDLGPRAGQKFAQYSLGMKQRLGVAAALLKDPELLVLDEPTNGLDPQGMIDMRRLVVELGRGDRTVLVSSHLLGEVEQMCSRVGVIRKGVLVAEGRLDELRGKAFLIVRAAPEAAARRVLEQAAGPGGVSAGPGGELHADVPASRVPEVNRALVAAGAEVSELRMSVQSLEDVFLELTGTEGGF